MSKWKSFIIAMGKTEYVADIVEYDVSDKLFKKINKLINEGKSIEDTLITSEKLKSLASEAFDSKCKSLGINREWYEIESSTAFDPGEYKKFMQEFIGQEVPEKMINSSKEYSFEVEDEYSYDILTKFIVKISYSEQRVVTNIEITSMEIPEAKTLSGEKCTYFYPRYSELSDAISRELEW